MTSIILRNAARFFLLVLLQVLVFNHIQISSYYIPQLYILFILLLPFETPKWLMLVLGFLLGLFIDMFSYTVGLHTAACTLIGFLAPWVQNIVATKQEYEPGMQPGIRGLGFKWFLSYTLIIVTVHHLVVYFLDAFRFSDVFTTLYRAGVNILLTTAVIMIVQLLIGKTGRARGER
jgi:cell shape-determining protein MreD